MKQFLALFFSSVHIFLRQHLKHSNPFYSKINDNVYKYSTKLEKKLASSFC